MAVYSLPSNKPFVGKNIRRKEPTPEQKKLKEILKTHTMQLVGFEEDGTPVIKVVKKKAGKLHADVPVCGR